MTGFKVSTEEKVFREKKNKIYLILPEKHEFHIGYLTFNRSQYGHHIVSANHETHCAFSWSENAMNSVQRGQRQSHTETL